MVKFFRIILFVGVFTNFCHSATISGTVKDGLSGSFLSNALVLLCRDYGTVDSYTTDADGKYSFGNIATTGEYRVVMHITSYPKEERYFLIMKATDAITADFTLFKMVPEILWNKVSFSVKDSLTGNPLENDSIKIVLNGGSVDKYYKTDAEGSIETLMHLQPGINSFKIEINGYKTKIINKTVDGTELVNLDIVVSPQVYSQMFGKITDSISGLPISHMNIYLSSTQGFYQYRTQTSDDGSYTIDSLAADEYRVSLYRGGSVSTADYISKYIEGVTIGNTPLLKNMVMRKVVYSNVFGKITDSTGRAISGVDVHFYSSDESGSMVTTNADGLYFFNKVKGDPARNITLYINICNNYELDRVDTVFSITSADPVEINIKLPTLLGTKVTGVVKDSLTGHPISNAIVRFREGLKEYVYDTTAPDGKYEFNFVRVGSPILTIRTMADNYINLDKVMDAACTDIVTDFPMTKASTVTTIEKVNEPINPSLQLLYNGSLKLSNLKDAGELSIMGLNGKVFYRCPIEKGNVVVPLPQQTLLSKCILIVKVKTGKQSLQQIVFPFSK